MTKEAAVTITLPGTAGSPSSCRGSGQGATAQMRLFARLSNRYVYGLPNRVETEKEPGTDI